MSHIDFDYVFALRMNYEEEYHNEKDIIVEIINNLKASNMPINEIPIFLKNFYENVGINISEDEIRELYDESNESNENSIIQENSIILPTSEEINSVVSFLETFLGIPLANNNSANVANDSSSNIVDNIADNDDMPDLIDNNNYNHISNNFIHYLEQAIVSVANSFSQINFMNILVNNNIHRNNEDVVASLSTEDINKLKKYKLEETLENPCSICKTSMEKDEEVCHLECGHIHHSECIEPWFNQYNYRCPMCRQEVGKPKYNNLT